MISGVTSYSPSHSGAFDPAFQRCALHWRIRALLRLIVFLLIAHRQHLSIDGYANLYDGHSYLITARAMLGNWSQFDDFHGRVFPAFPAMIAMVGLTRVPLTIAAIGIDWISAAAAASLAAVLFNDRRVGWAMACLIPHYLMNSTMAMSEAPLLALTLAGLVIARPRGHRSNFRTIAGGMVLGWAGLVRPMACFAVMGSITKDIHRRRPLAAALTALASGGVVAAGMLALYLWRGDAVAGLRAQEVIAYAGHPFAWPFHSLLTTPAIDHVSPWRIGYIWTHVAVTLAGCAAVTWRIIRSARTEERDLLSTPWLLGNTAFVLCIGSVWGFECFHRFTIPALPALFWALRAFLPRNGWSWVPIAAGSAWIAVLSA